MGLDWFVVVYRWNQREGLDEAAATVVQEDEEEGDEVGQQRVREWGIGYEGGSGEEGEEEKEEGSGGLFCHQLTEMNAVCK